MKPKYAYALGALSALANVASADLRFRSRPELAIPRLNIRTPAYGHATEKGLIFITPYEGFAEGHQGPTQPGAYIIRDDGELVWSGTGFHAGWGANFRPETWDGKQYLRVFQGTLMGFMDVVRAGSHRSVSAHEFRVPWGGSNDQRWIVSGGFQGVNIETGDVLLEWEKSGPSPFLSARNIAAFFKINGTSGQVTWQLGGYRGGSDFEIAETEVFAFEHHARFRGRSLDGSLETISFFDNGAHSAPVQIRPYSRARVVQLNHTSGVATSLRTYDAPDGLSARTQGSVQLFPNGNVFVDWGEAVSRFVQSYRGFRANWTAIPAEEPAIATFVSRESTLTFLDINISWNGDTETKTWRVYSRPSTGESAVLVGKAQRDGFETKIRLQGIHDLESSVFFAEAVDGDGKTLRKTRDVSMSGDPADRHPAMIVQGNEEL
ncbi:ASST-domain-containing protein [Verticillium dahliae]|nr:ASST-domain-containing protein [Verticillium dahliae]